MSSFSQLVERFTKILEGPVEFREEALGKFRPEVQAQLAFPEEQDPVARGLRLGREALAHLVEGEFSAASEKLREALSLNPGLGRGKAYRLLEVLSRFDGCQVPEEELKELGAIVAEIDADPAIALSRRLLDIPPEFWYPLFLPSSEGPGKGNKKKNK